MMLVSFLGGPGWGHSGWHSDCCVLSILKNFAKRIPRLVGGPSCFLLREKFCLVVSWGLCGTTGSGEDNQTSDNRAHEPPKGARTWE